MLAGIHRAFGRTRTHQRVHLVDKENDLALGAGDFLEHGFEPLFKFAAIFGAGDQCAQIQRDHVFCRAGWWAHRR